MISCFLVRCRPQSEMTLAGPGTAFMPFWGLAQVASPSERKNAPCSVQKCPKLRFFYLHKAIWKMPDAQKWGIFFTFHGIFISKRKCPMSQKMPNFPKKALEMPCWQQWPHILSPSVSFLVLPVSNFWDLIDNFWELVAKVTGNFFLNFWV